MKMWEDKLMYNLLITSYLEEKHIDRIRQVKPERVQVNFEPSLMAPPRYPADHYGVPERTAQQEAAWRQLLGSADILFDFDYSHLQELPDLAPRVRWIQASSAGIGQLVKRYAYDTRMPNTTFTTASGIHARPLAEFVLLGMLSHFKDLPLILRQQRASRWQRMAGSDLESRSIAIVGLGSIGREVAAMARALGMLTLGCDVRPAPEAVDRFFPVEQLHSMLPLAEVVVVCVPHTPETEKMIAAPEFRLMPKGTYFINIARGAVVDEPALVEALQGGHLAGAALDVFAQEPLPADSPFWRMENVIVSPHSAGTSDRENQRLTDLFCDNLQRFLDKQPLRNVLNAQLYY